eukprot:scaffold10.g2327.t1
MGHATAEAVVRAGLTLVPFSFTGSSEAVAVGRIGVRGIPVELVHPDERVAVLQAGLYCCCCIHAAELCLSRVVKVRQQWPDLVVVDYTLPSIVNDNVLFYCEHRLPFVMGTTGGDREKLLADVTAAGNYAVIAPNMGKQIVAFQARGAGTMMETMAEKFPGCFAGYKLHVVESHQRTKADTSGTAKAVVQSFNKMGLPYEEASDGLMERCAEIEKVRDEEQQVRRMGVPDSALGGHAFHTYTVTSPDGSVTLEFKHNVVGREVYAEGTVDAAIFLAQQIKAGAEQKLYSMIDVLSAGAMR